MNRSPVRRHRIARLIAAIAAITLLAPAVPTAGQTDSLPEPLMSPPAYGNPDVPRSFPADVTLPNDALREPATPSEPVTHVRTPEPSVVALLLAGGLLFFVRHRPRHPA